MLPGIVVALLVLLAVVLVVRLLEPKFAFFPIAGERETPSDFGTDFQGTFVDTRDGERLRVWTVPGSPSRPVVLYFHGNGGNLSMWAPIVVAIAQRGYSVIACDYRGYGLSTGRPTERGLYRDVEAVVDWARRVAIDQRPVVYWGRSLGATLAAYAATVQPPDGVILEAGFPDTRSLLRSVPPLALLGLFSSYRFPTAAFLRTVQAPVLVMHGDIDSVIPFRLGRLLYERVNGPKQFVRLAGTDHNDPIPRDPEAYWSAIDRFTEAVVLRQRR